MTSPRAARRFCELERSLQGISPRTLSLRLRALEEEGIVERQTFAEVPPRVEYALTDKGLALLPIIDDMREYGTALARRATPAPQDEAPAARPSPRSRSLRRNSRRAAGFREAMRARDRAGVDRRRPSLASSRCDVLRLTRRRALALGAAAGLGVLLGPRRSSGARLAVPPRGPAAASAWTSPRPACRRPTAAARSCARRGASTWSGCAAAP